MLFSVKGMRPQEPTGRVIGGIFITLYGAVLGSIPRAETTVQTGLNSLIAPLEFDYSLQ
jgi:hypothetical protein